MELSVCLCRNVHTCQRKHVPSITKCTKCKYMKNFIFLIKIISATWYRNKGLGREGDLGHSVFIVVFFFCIHCWSPQNARERWVRSPRGFWVMGWASLNILRVDSIISPSCQSSILTCSLELQGRTCWDPQHVRFVWEPIKLGRYGSCKPRIYPHEPWKGIFQFIASGGVLGSQSEKVRRILAAVMPPVEMGCRVLKSEKDIWLWALGKRSGFIEPREQQEGSLVKGRRNGRNPLALSCQVYYEF